jgi:uncharacterized linocin/CFP29 family protein
MENLATGKAFWGGASGRWAGEQLLKALSENKQISPSLLRTLTTLRKDEWKVFDDTLVSAAQERLVAVADLIERGLTSKISNAMGKTVLEYDLVGDMNEAQVSMDGAAQTENDRIEFDTAGLPLPITHKDFWINLRTLVASRSRGDGLDTTQIRISGRKIAEAQEELLVKGTVNGVDKQFQGLKVYGYLSHPKRNLDTFGTNGAWNNAAKTGDNMVDDVLSMLAMMDDDKQTGPFVLYVPKDAKPNLEKDFKTNGTLSARQRLLQIEGLEAIKTLPSLPSANLLMVQMTEDTVKLVQGEPLQTIQWDTQGGFHVNFKAFQIQVPLIRADQAGNIGLVHMTV